MPEIKCSPFQDQMSLKEIHCDELPPSLTVTITNKVKFCGIRRCSTSTGICGSTTHGYGEFDPLGYNSHPCFICARHYEEKSEDGTVKNPQWPFRLPPEKLTPTSPSDVMRIQLRQDTHKTILRVLEEEGSFLVGDLHSRCLDKIPESSWNLIQTYGDQFFPFDEVFCDFIEWGKVMLDFSGEMPPGPLVSLATRTKMPNAK